MSVTEPRYRTGYWADAKGNRSGVHLEVNGIGACGYRPAVGMIFQFCATGIHPAYMTCRRCRRIVLKIMTAGEGGSDASH